MAGSRGIALLLLGLGLSAISSAGCSSVLYHPTHEVHWDPAKAGLKPEDVFFRSESGELLHGWLIRAPGQKKPKARVVFFHGNGENLTSHYVSLAWLLDHGYEYFVFDYAGYGRSTGKPSPEGTVQDGRAALKWAYRAEPKLPIIIFGQSLGGAVALRTAIELKREVPFRLVVVDSTFHSYQAAGRKVLAGQWLTWPFQWVAWLLLSDQHAPGDRIAELSPVPLVVIHGDADGVVDHDLGRKVYDLAKPPKRFITVSGGRHTDALWRVNEPYRAKMLAELDAAIP